MTRKTRVILASLAALLFLILAPVLVLYSMGYRFGTEVKAVGMMYLRSVPKDANVYIDGKLFKKTTPTAITELKKGEYEIKVEKNGFSTWKKKLPVSPNVITEVRNIYLLPLSLTPKLITEHSITYYKISPSQEKIAYITEDEASRGIWILNLKDLSKTQVFSKTIYKNLEVPDTVEWSGDSKKILFLAEPESKNFKATSPKYFIIDIEKPTEFIDLSNFIPTTIIQELRWHPTDSNRIFYTTQNKREEVLGVFGLNLVTGETVQILSGDIISYAFSSNEIYFVKKKKVSSQTKMEFWKANLDGTNPHLILESLPPETDYQILLSQDKNVLLFTPSGKKLYLLNPFSDQLEILEDDEVTEAKWSPNGKYILYVKDNREFWVYNFDNKKSVFLKPGEEMRVAKYADPIQEIAWFSTSEHILFKINGEIKMIEVDPRGGINLNKITDCNSAQEFNVGKDGEVFYFVNATHDTEKLYEILLTEKEIIQDIIR